MVTCIISCGLKIFDFVLFMAVLIIFLSVAFTNLGVETKITNKFNIYLANGLLIFRKALGDFETSNFDQLEGGPFYMVWILFIFLAFFTTIVYTNILIAVVSDEFSRVYEQRDTILYKTRMPYIIEYWDENKTSIQVQNFVVI